MAGRKVVKHWTYKNKYDTHTLIYSMNMQHNTYLHCDYFLQFCRNDFHPQRFSARVEDHMFFGKDVILKNR